MSTNRGRIRTLIADGVSISDIAIRLDLAPATVRYHVARLQQTDPPLAVTAADSPRPTPPTTRVRVRALLDEGLTHAEIAARLGISRPAVSYHARRPGEPLDDRCARRYDWLAIQEFYDDGHTVRQCAEHFGFCTASWSQAVRRGSIVPRRAAMSIEELCVEGRPRGREYLKLRLIRAGLKSACCERCGLTQWQGAPIVFALHHVNGRRTDNRLENLQLLCPNCHSQTDNFAGRRHGRRSKSDADPAGDDGDPA